MPQPATVHVPASPATTVRLANGLTLVVLEAPERHQVLVAAMVRVGSRFESAGDNGISHFLEHLLFRGNRHFADADALNRAFEAVGGVLDAQTGVEETEYSFVAHPAHVERGLACLAQFLRAPTFPDIEKERRILLEELSYDYNDQGALTHLPTLISQLMWPRHPLGQTVGGVPATVEATTRAQIAAHHARHYTPDNLVLAVAGRVEADAVQAAVERHFGDWAPGGAPPLGRTAGMPGAPAAPPVRTVGPHARLVADADNQFHLQLGFHAPGYNDADEVAAGLLTRILDDGPTTRLPRIIREELALVYHIEAQHTGYWDAGALEITTAVRADALVELLGHLLRTLADFRDAGPTTDELERARVRHLFDLEFGLDSLSGRIDRYAWPLLYSTVRDETEERERVRAVTREELSALAGRLLHRTNLHLALVGPLTDAHRRAVDEALAAY